MSCDDQTYHHTYLFCGQEHPFRFCSKRIFCEWKKRFCVENIFLGGIKSARGPSKTQGLICTPAKKRFIYKKKFQEKATKQVPCILSIGLSHDVI